MKLIGICFYYENLNKKNFVLLNSNAGIGDDLLKPFNHLYVSGQKKGIEFATLDMREFDDFDGFIFFDFPRLKNKLAYMALNSKKPKFLVTFESEVIKKDNWDINNHIHFEKIFTWNDDIIDNKKYFKLNFSHELPKQIDKDLSNKEKLCTMISSNKKVNHPLELYSKRVETIRWFEENHLEDFDLYGIGWDEFITEYRYLNFLLRKIKLSKIFKPNFPSYKGAISSKKNTLTKYKFAICYENAKDISGYITEKIFDCFIAGCVPIYLGPQNILDHIPIECFIDKRNFNNYDELYNYMANMTDKQYLSYLNNIEIFLNSDKAFKFSVEYFSDTLINSID